MEVGLVVIITTQIVDVAYPTMSTPYLEPVLPAPTILGAVVAAAQPPKDRSKYESGKI